MAGIGNIYADEALWQAGLHPERRCGALRAPGVRALHAGIVTVLTEGVARGGSTLRDYVDARGERGGYLEVAAVYGRTGSAVPTVRHPDRQDHGGGAGDPRLPVVPARPPPPAHAGSGRRGRSRT